MRAQVCRVGVEDGGDRVAVLDLRATDFNYDELISINDSQEVTIHAGPCAVTISDTGQEYVRGIEEDLGLWSKRALTAEKRLQEIARTPLGELEAERDLLRKEIASKNTEISRLKSRVAEAETRRPPRVDEDDLARVWRLAQPLLLRPMKGPIQRDSYLGDLVAAVIEVCRTTQPDPSVLPGVYKVNLELSGRIKTNKKPEKPKPPDAVAARFANIDLDCNEGDDREEEE